MKLAEALLLRAEQQQKLDSLQGRILTNLRVQEGDAPFEDPQALLAQSDALFEEMSALIRRINARNNDARLPDGRTLSEALVDRDVLLKRRNLCAAVARGAVEKDYRVTRSEIRILSTVNVADVQRRIDALSRDYRQLDAQIQSLNWTVDL